MLLRRRQEEYSRRPLWLRCVLLRRDSGLVGVRPKSAVGILLLVVTDNLFGACHSPRERVTRKNVCGTQLVNGLSSGSTEVSG